ncbi:MAG: hypothetical protein M3496_15305 [Pseudomonadota bacterium]|nr:hypothetical protein [Pseudomonadota bacterium]
MDRKSSLATLNDFMHAVVVSGALLVTALGLFDELFSFRGDDVLAVVASAVTGASLAYAATLSQPSQTAMKAALVCRRADLETISL